MSEVGTTIRAGSSLRALRRILIVSLALGAVLVGIFALHSMAASSTAVSAVALGSSQYTELGDVAATDQGALPAASLQQEGAAFPLLVCAQNCEMGCALIAMTCLLLVVLFSMLFFARYPAFLHRLLDSSRRAILGIPVARNHIYLPSLTVLSISRI